MALTAFIGGNQLSVGLRAFHACLPHGNLNEGKVLRGHGVVYDVSTERTRNNPGSEGARTRLDRTRGVLWMNTNSPVEPENVLRRSRTGDPLGTSK